MRLRKGPGGAESSRPLKFPALFAIFFFSNRWSAGPDQALHSVPPFARSRHSVVGAQARRSLPRGGCVRIARGLLAKKVVVADQTLTLYIGSHAAAVSPGKTDWGRTFGCSWAAIAPCGFSSIFPATVTSPSVCAQFARHFSCPREKLQLGRMRRGGLQGLLAGRLAHFPSVSVDSRDYIYHPARGRTPWLVAFVPAMR